MSTEIAHPDLTQRPPRSMRQRLGGFVLGQHSKTREDIKSWFEAVDLDDYVSFGGKP